MNIRDALKQEPFYIQKSPVVQSMIQLLLQQTKQIQQQTKQIQRQVEQISTLEKNIEDLKDEISRLNKTPKRPRFKPNKMEPRNREKGNSQEDSSKNDKNICIPEKSQEEVRIKAKKVPKGSRFKGYSEFSIQDLEIIVSTLQLLAA